MLCKVFSISKSLVAGTGKPRFARWEFISLAGAWLGGLCKVARNTNIIMFIVCGLTFANVVALGYSWAQQSHKELAKSAAPLTGSAPYH